MASIGDIIPIYEYDKVVLSFTVISNEESRHLNTYSYIVSDAKGTLYRWNIYGTDLDEGMKLKMEDVYSIYGGLAIRLENNNFMSITDLSPT